MHYTVKEKKVLPKSEYLLIIEIPPETVASEESHVLAQIKKDTELPGFRKGFVPENILRARMGEMALFEEAATHALSEALEEIFRAEKLDVIGRPRVEVLKLVPGNTAEFRVALSLYPQLLLPDYKKIAKEHAGKKIEVTDIEEKEIDTVIAEIKKHRETTTGKKDSEITDDSVKEFGPFKTVADFRAKVKDGLTERKTEKHREKRRAELLDRLTDKSRGEIPNVLIESELSRMESELRSEIERMGASFDGYLKEIKKSQEEMRKEWYNDAEKRVRLQLMLVQIARSEKIAVPEEQIEKEMRYIIEHYKNADAKNARSYVETFFTNQKVLQFLETQK